MTLVLKKNGIRVFEIPKMHENAMPIYIYLLRNEKNLTEPEQLLDTLSEKRKRC